MESCTPKAQWESSKTRMKCKNISIPAVPDGFAASPALGGLRKRLWRGARPGRGSGSRRDPEEPLQARNSGGIRAGGRALHPLAPAERETEAERRLRPGWGCLGWIWDT